MSERVVAPPPTEELPAVLSPTTTSPSRERPNPLLRGLSILAAIATVLIVLWFGLSPTGVAVVEDAADSAREVVREVEDTLDADLVSRSDVPWELDELAHIGGWACVMVASGLFLGRRRDLGRLAAIVFGGSVAIELMQKLLTSTREFQATDISANALGIMFGLLALLVLDQLRPARSPG